MVSLLPGRNKSDQTRSGSRSKKSIDITSLPSTAERRKQRVARLAADMRNSGKMKFCAGMIVGCIICIAGTWGILAANRLSMDSHSAADSQAISQIQQENKAYLSNCTVLQNCATFPKAQAVDAALDYDTQCMNYSAQQLAITPTDQSDRLAGAGGPKDCGWQNDGVGYGTLFHNSALEIPIKDASGNIRADVGTVGFNVRMTGQPVPFHYVSVVSNTAGKLAVTSSAIYTSPPTIAVSNCVIDTTANSDRVMKRLQQLEDGRTGMTSVDPNDYVDNGFVATAFGPSITKVTVASVNICQAETSTGMSQALALERFDGPTKGAHFQFTIGYTYHIVGDKLSFTGYGPVIGTIPTS